MFEKSFNASVDHYRRFLEEEKAGRLRLENINFDVGEPLGPGKYELTDKAEEELVHRLNEDGFQGVSKELRAHLLAYFADKDGATELQKDKKSWARLQVELSKLREVESAYTN